MSAPALSSSPKQSSSPKSPSSHNASFLAQAPNTSAYWLSKWHLWQRHRQKVIHNIHPPVTS